MNPEKSKCQAGYLHRYVITDTLENGVIERCVLCKDKRFFHTKAPNYHYLSYHLRSALQTNHPLFKHEYGR